VTPFASVPLTALAGIAAYVVGAGATVNAGRTLALVVLVLAVLASKTYTVIKALINWVRCNHC
jgi:hypothetical protein